MRRGNEWPLDRPVRCATSRQFWDNPAGLSFAKTPLQLARGIALVLLTAFSLESPQGRFAFGQYGQQDVEDLAAKHYYAHVRSIVDYSPLELKHKYFYLKHLEPARSQEALPGILKQVGENVDLLFKNFPNTTCKEIVYSSRLKNDGSFTQGLSQEFNYVILARPEGGQDEFQEYRTDSKGQPMSPAVMGGASLLTEGFASMPVHFLPRYQSQSHFLYLGHEMIKKKETLVSAFAQIFGKAREVGLVNVAGQNALILTQGVAWIDPETFQILRLRTEHLAPRPDVGLRQQTTDINFGPVRFKNSPATLWLPRQVSVLVTWTDFTFHNIHNYSHFRLFQVQTSQAITSHPVAKP
jgi:hypothetical protein